MTEKDPTLTAAGRAGTDYPVILFDGDCGFCNSGVRFVARRDRTRAMHFAPLFSPVGQALLEKHGLRGTEDDTFTFVAGDRAYQRSSGVLGVLGRMTLPWRLLAVGWLVPRPLRDLLYRLMAASRYYLPAPAPTCEVPDPAWSARVLG